MSIYIFLSTSYDARGSTDNFLSFCFHSLVLFNRLVNTTIAPHPTKKTQTAYQETTETKMLLKLLGDEWK